jgi:hypothetical protein
VWFIHPPEVVNIHVNLVNLIRNVGGSKKLALVLVLAPATYGWGDRSIGGAWPLLAHGSATSSNTTELRGILGITRYYRKFVKNYGILIKALTALLKKKKAFQWTALAQEAFAQLKTAISTTLVITLPDFDKSFSIETDACDTGIGAMLAQEGYPMAYYIKALGINSQKLSIY